MTTLVLRDKNLIHFAERIIMQINKKIWLSVFAGLLILACAEKAPVYPWISDLDAPVETDGKIVGYEVYAKW